MSMIRLTTFDGNRVPTPVSINPDHVISTRPRKQLTPVDAQQQPNATFVYKGTMITLIDGERLNVVEDHDEVDHKLHPQQGVPFTPEVKKVVKGA